MLPTEGHEAKFVGSVGAELDVETGRKAARLAALNVLAVARQHLGSRNHRLENSRTARPDSIWLFF
jgi:hypothetical protein